VLHALHVHLYAHNMEQETGKYAISIMVLKDTWPFQNGKYVCAVF